MNSEDWKSKGWVNSPTLPGRYEGEISGDPTQAEVDAMYPEYTHLSNKRYSDLMADYLTCTTVFMH